jgi:uncharacterized protein (DUF952 family)
MSSDAKPDTAARVFKICPRADWAAAVKVGAMHGSADDLRDGYIHLSTAAQATETARKYFAGRADLVLVGYDAAALGSQLAWEPSRGGALFPHLYAWRWPYCRCRSVLMACRTSPLHSPVFSKVFR